MAPFPHSAHEPAEGGSPSEGSEPRQVPPSPYNDPYEILGAPRDAAAERIRDAYFAQVRAHPPERDPEAFKAIRAAYDRLRTPEQRLETDMLLLKALDLSAELSAPPFDLTLHREDIL